MLGPPSGAPTSFSTISAERPIIELKYCYPRPPLMRGAVLALLLLAAAAVALAAAPSDAAPTPAPQDLYGDADFILTADKDGNTVITYRSPVVDPKPGEPDYEWKSRTTYPGTDFEASQLSTIGESVYVVVDGATIGKLSLLYVDDLSQEKYVSLKLLVVSGEISKINAVTVKSSLRSQLGTSYSSVFTPVEQLDIIIDGGAVTQFQPTSDMVGVDYMTVTVSEGASVDRFLTSGSNGRYETITIDLKGGSIGYMSNQKSRIGEVYYNLENGSIDYLCIGADCESSGNSHLKDAPTSYIAGDVFVYINGSVTTRAVILGAGSVNVPNILWNGERVKPLTTKDVILQAPSCKISIDSCFLTERRTSVYNFSNYRIGSTPSAVAISTTYYDDSGSSFPVYGQDGIWDGYDVQDFPMGTSMFCDCILAVGQDAKVLIDNGGRLITTGTVLLEGSIDNDGTLSNGGIIEIIGSGDVTGKVSGSGYVASYIRYSSSDPSISVISTEDTVVIEHDGEGTVSEISASLDGGDRSISVAAPEGAGYTTKTFLLSMRPIEVIEGFDAAYQVTIGGIPASTLSYSTVEASYRAYIEAGYVADIYRYDEATNSYVLESTVEPGAGAVTFSPTACTSYQVKYVDSGVGPVEKDNTPIIAALVAAIIAVGALTVFFAFRKRVRSAR